MKQKSNISELIEEFSKEPLSAHVARKKKFWLRSSLPAFVPGYIAAPKEMFDKITEYLAHELGIPASEVYALQLRERDYNYLNLFMENKEDFRKATGDTLLIKIHGFQKTKKLLFDPERSGMRAAHDFNQDLEKLLPDFHAKAGYVGENPYPWDLQKRLIIASHLDPRENNFSCALESACTGNFSDFVWSF